LKTLLLGCGNIGSQYDFENEFILTHSKAIFFSNWIDSVDIFDKKIKLSKKVSSKYNFNLIKNINDIQFNNYDIVVIATPTETHFSLLNQCIQSGVKYVICEKPISYSIQELNKIEHLIQKKNSKIFINYYRRFQKSYEQLKKDLNPYLFEISSIKVTYYKGILNYASHAIDTLNFFFGSVSKIELKKINNKFYDYFENDPTVNAYVTFNDIDLHLNGQISNVPLFEIEIKSGDHTILIYDLGNKAKIKRGDVIIKHYDNLLKDNMKDVYNYIENSIYKKINNDNFRESLILNKQLINLL
jgi:predicted dehydrogenase